MARTISTYSSTGITLTSATDNPLSVTSTGTITDASGNALYGPGGGSESWTIDNSGSIGARGLTGNGVKLGSLSAPNAGVGYSMVTNATGGAISSSVSSAVYIAGPGSVTNLSGAEVRGGGGSAVFISGDASLGVTGQPNVQVYNAGTLSGPGVGVNEQRGGSVTNIADGTITGDTAQGVYLGGEGTVTNSGSISGGTSGVDLTNAGTVTNLNGGDIDGGNGVGVRVNGTYGVGGGANVLVDNAGTLSGSTGVYEFFGGSVTNSGTITGQSGPGIFLDGPGTVVNSGTVNGAGYGVYLYESGSIDNLAVGTISGDGGVFIGYFAGLPGTFTNAGTVIATGASSDAVQFGSGTYDLGYRLIVDPGAVFDGKVDGGGGGTVELAGSRVGTLSGFGDTITNFSTLQFDSGADWRISGNTGGLSTMAITGFAGGDIIDLTGFAAASETFSGGNLTLTSGNTHVFLNFPDQTSLGDFQFAPDGAGGTDIALFGSGQPINWTATGSADWNTASNWDLDTVPTGFDNATIANPVSTVATIATKASNVVGSLTIGDPSDSLNVGGTLDVLSTVTVEAGALTVTASGTLSAIAIIDNSLLAFAGNQLLDGTPLDLGDPDALQSAGTLEVRGGGELTLGTNETVTQFAPDAVMDGDGTITNKGSIDATTGDSLTITPLNFVNQGTISGGGGELTVGNHAGSWSNSGGTIANAATLILDGAVTTGNLGSITGAFSVIEAGRLDNKGATLNVGATTDLGTITLASGGTISGGTIVDAGGGLVFNGGTLDNVTYQGSLELTGSASATIVNGLTVLPGTIDLTGDGATLDFVATPTLSGVTINIGANEADVLRADGGGTFTIGKDVTIDTGVAGLFASLTAGAGTTLDLEGTLSAIGSDGTFTLDRGIGGTFANDGTIIVGNGDLLDVNTPITASSGGTVELNSTGIVNVSSAVAANQTFAFADASGLLRLDDPASFAATVTGIDQGATIDLTNFKAVDSSYANGVLTLGDGIGNTVTLHIPGTFTSDEFQLTPDGNGTDITWTPVGQTFTWTDGSDNWNAPTAWSLGAVPKGFDSAVIGDAASNTITVSDAEAITNLTLNGINDTLEITVTGNLQAGPIAINSGTLAVRDGGSLAATQIADHGLLDLGGNHELINTPLSLGGTLQVSPSAFGVPGTLTLQDLVLTQDLASAAIISTGNDGNFVINQGTIIAGVPGGSMAIVPMNFTNSGTGGINADNETLTIGNHLGSWSNKDGTIALSGTAALVLDGSLATTNIGKITGATGVTEVGLLDNTGDTLDVGTGTQLGTVNLAHGAMVSGGTIADNGNGFTFNSDGTFSGVTYQGPLELTEDSASLTINQGITVTGTGGAQPGTIDVTGKSDSLLFTNQPPVLGQTLDNVTINIGNASGVDNLVPRFSGGTFTIGNSATIASTTPGANANLTAGSNTTVDFDGTLNATANNGAFAVSGAALSIFNNSGLINVGNGDTFSVGRDISGGTGTIDIGTNGVVDLAGSVATGQTIAFTDATGSLQLEQPGNVAATILNFAPGDRIELGKVPADSATWSADQLTISNAGTTVATLSLPGGYASSLFAVAGGPGGSEVTVTATCFAAGTRILTPHGEVAVEHLRKGDLVQTISGRAQPVSWIGHRRVNFRRHPNRQRILPVRVAAHAFGPGMPRRELLLSPDHAVFVEDVLIPIRHLINGSTVAQIERHAITYYHVELPRHDVLLANGMPAESYLEAGARNAFANGGGTIHLHPDFTPPLDHHSMLWEEHGYAPLAVTGAALERARHSVARQVNLAA